jgi:hypothetical protein
MKDLVSSRLNGNDKGTYLAPIDSFEFKIVFGIITHKDTGQKSKNLPLFSRISLMRNMQQLDLMKIPTALIFIEDKSARKEGHSKHVQILVEVYAGTTGKIEIRPIAGQAGYDPQTPIKDAQSKSVRARSVFATGCLCPEQRMAA